MVDEGVIKYRLEYQPAAPFSGHDYTKLDFWHQRFKAEKILGQDPQRYGGLGFGNLSQRIDRESFLISGTQTGGLPRLTEADYALVTEVDLNDNRVVAQGPVRPSSESLTHAAVYRLDDRIQFVFHVHSPEIWRAREQLGIAQTRADIAYGTPQMAKEMFRIYRHHGFTNGSILAMAGHEDGIIGFAENADNAGEIILDALAIARSD